MGELAVLRKLAANPLDQYVFLRELRRKDEDEFFRLLTTHMSEVLPIVYTPPVGAVCQQYHNLELETVGLYLTPDDAGGGILPKLLHAAKVPPPLAPARAPTTRPHQSEGLPGGHRTGETPGGAAPVPRRPPRHHSCMLSWPAQQSPPVPAGARGCDC